MTQKTIRIAISGTGFAGDYTASTYSMIPHKNGVHIELAGVISGRRENAEKFAVRHNVTNAFDSHEEMLKSVQPDIDNICCANFAHGPYATEAGQAGVPVIVLEKPPVIWPGYPEGRTADAATRKEESMDYLATVLDAVRAGKSKLLYAEDFIYVDGVKGIVELLIEAQKQNKGKVLYQSGVCAHQGSHAPAYDTPSKSGGGALFNKACHPLGPALYLKQVEGILNGTGPIRPVQVSAAALQILKHQPETSHEFFRPMQNVDDFGRITVMFEDRTIAEVHGHDLSISGIRNEFSVITDFAEYDVRMNPNNENELFLPEGTAAGNILLREKLSTPQGTSFPRPNQTYSHGYVNEMNDAVDCALESDRSPQSGPMMAWDTMAVLMASYESADADGRFVDISEYTVRGRQFTENEIPDPHRLGKVFQRQ
ncbi:Gfo/Idh/MocA family protein [Thalassoglobus polymorphus]|uniref:Putative oxidoreductase YcjS n=1 Tax=Thalassoglobus polymorphus TaxID=2527994 RepID=A0A517QKU5_9PLAN|nr:Gfo/Idh/MocA family oxidoreductase [Thalassoglobus polymorphus]QDT32269.1 putative oxidoreductase YcjS [Thalassoglobus polymorphus]